MSNDTPNQPEMENTEAFYRRLKPEGKRLILSIDGGGSKGLITLHCLVKLAARNDLKYLYRYQSM